MKKIAILTVTFLRSEESNNMAKAAYTSFPKDLYTITVINDNSSKFPVNEYCDKSYSNKENCLAGAWNIGLKKLFVVNGGDFDYALCTNLDVVMSKELVDKLYQTHVEHPEAGIVSAQFTQSFGELYQEDSNSSTTEVKHGDGSFSCFMISKEAFKKIGKFDERYKPAYFEDNDYLERAWKAGYKPLKRIDAIFWHVVQGTLKTDIGIAKTYGDFMQKNLEIFKETYRKVPDHLPKDIRFT